MKNATIIAVLLTAMIFSIQAMDDNIKLYFDLAKQFEVTERAIPPKWGTRTKPPLFRIAWISDQHITDEDTAKISQQALEYIRDTIQPQAVVITGDNIGYSYRGQKEPRPALRRQQEFQTMLKQTLGDIPFFVLPGDNWPEAFDQVFGATHYSFDLGGFHFIFNTVDCTGVRNGCAKFSQETWQWLRDDLAKHASQPVVYLQHEPCLPPSFLDAPQLAELFDQTPQLMLALAGHLHLDLDFANGHWKQWVGPSVGRSHRPGFKVLAFYPDQILATSIEWDTTQQIFRQVNKFQRVKIPESWRANLHAPLPDELSKSYSGLPHAPRMTDRQLDALEDTVMQNVKAFGVRFAMSRFLKE